MGLARNAAFTRQSCREIVSLPAKAGVPGGSFNCTSIANQDEFLLSNDRKFCQ